MEREFIHVEPLDSVFSLLFGEVQGGEFDHSRQGDPIYAPEAPRSSPTRERSASVELGQTELVLEQLKFCVKRAGSVGSEDVKFHLFDTGHFALEEDLDRIGSLIHGFRPEGRSQRARPRDSGRRQSARIQPCAAALSA